MHLAVARPDLIVADLHTAARGGITLLASVLEKHPALPVIVLAARASISEAVAATRRGVFAFLTKPVDPDALLEQISQAARLSGQLPQECDASRAEDWCNEILHRSPIMAELLSQARLAAQTDAHVLLCGDAGTGKEMLARAMHRVGSRHDGPFMVVRADVPEAHLEAALSGNASAGNGALTLASGGTLFLKDVDELPASTQVRLVRAIEGSSAEGSTPRAPIYGAPSKVALRVIAASRRDLEGEVLSGRLRADLYYHLRAVRLDVPRLSQRCEDIPLLASHFLARQARAAGRDVRGLSPQAAEALCAAPWPGNVRELRSVVEQFVALSSSPIVSLQQVRQAMGEGTTEIQPFSDARRAFERDYFVHVLKAANGNVSRAALLADRNRTEFYKLLQRHNLSPAAFRAPATQTGR